MSSRTALRTCGVLFCLLAVSNFLKPLQLTDTAGFVLFGVRLGGTANLVAAVVFGLYLAVYGIGVLTMRRYALPMGIAYAAYVLANLLLFSRMAPAAQQPPVAFSFVYAVVAIGVSSGAVLLLQRHRAALH
jgi:hypothetical protein